MKGRHKDNVGTRALKSAVDLLNLTICCRYLEALLRRPRVKRFVAKNHSGALKELEKVLAEFNSDHILFK